MLVLYLVWHSLPSAAPQGKVPHVPLLRLALLGAGMLCVAWSGHVTPLGLRLALLGSASVCVVLAFRCDAGATHRLFPSQPLALTTPVGTGFWIMFLFGLMASQISVFLPLVLQILHGVSPLGAGYFAVLAGVGQGLCFAHLSSWTITAARPGEEERTPSWLPMAQQLGNAFGTAATGVVANAAGLAAGVSVSTVTAVATWVYGLSIVAPAIIALLTLRVLWFHKPAWPPFGLKPLGAN